MKIGDQVKVTAEYSGYYNNIGFIIEVFDGSDLPYTVIFDDEDDFMYFADRELELIK